jgi:response regulator RpfG family c-di-GMP phosphodiesterase
MITAETPLEEEISDTEELLTVLFVDDEINILKALTRLFREEPCHTVTASSGKEGLAILRETPNVGLIVSDQRMPEMSGTLFLKEAAKIIPDAPRMILTGYSDVNAAIDAINHGGATRFLMKPWNEHELRLAVRDGLQRYKLIQENKRLTSLVIEQKEELAEWNANLKTRVLQQTTTIRKQLEELHQQQEHNQKKNDAMVFLLADMLDRSHHNLSRHSRNVAALAVSMAANLKLPLHQQEEIRNAALLHDIGLVGMSDRVLSKNKDQLTGDELAEYRSHPARGQATIDTMEELQDIGRLIRHHHEEFAGGGFPDRLVGEKISIGGRILALANFIDNNYFQLTGVDAKYQMTRKIAAGMGTLFDPALAVVANQAVKDVLEDAPVLLQQTIVEQEVPLRNLEIGMVLTRDIYSTVGVLVVERGKQITPQSLDVIRRHQLNIPLNAMAFVKK